MYMYTYICIYIIYTYIFFIYTYTYNIYFLYICVYVYVYIYIWEISTIDDAIVSLKLVLFTRKYVNRTIYDTECKYTLRKEELYETGVTYIYKVAELVLNCVCNTRCLLYLLRIQHDVSSFTLFFSFFLSQLSILVDRRHFD